MISISVDTQQMTDRLDSAATNLSLITSAIEEMLKHPLLQEVSSEFNGMLSHLRQANSHIDSAENYLNRYVERTAPKKDEGGRVADLTRGGPAALAGYLP